jgi:hypothetical protein
MSPSIVTRFALAALATAFVLPAQSAPARATKPNQAQGEAKADEKVQTRLAEVIAMLEEEDLTPEQRAEAKKKLKEIGARLKQDAAKAQAGGAWTLHAPKVTTSKDGHVIVESKEGVYLVAPDSKPAEVREVEGFPVVEEKVVYRRYPDAGVTVPALPPTPDAAPSPARAPRAPRATRAPRALSPESAPAAPEAAEAPPLARLVVPEAGQAGPTPPRARRTRTTAPQEVPVETVREEVVEVEAPVKLRWTRAKAAEEARAEAEAKQEEVRVRGRLLEPARLELEAARERAADARSRLRFDEGMRDFGERVRAQADAARREAAEVRERAIEVVRGENSERLFSSRRDDEGKAKQGNLLFGRAVESRPAEAGDDEIRALIDEMRAEMRQIRALMQELRTRSDREEEVEQSVGAGMSRGGGTGAGGFSRVSEAPAAEVSGSSLGGQAPAAPTTAAPTSAEPKAVRVRAARSGATSIGGQASGFGTSGGSGQSQGTSPSSTAVGGGR